MNMSALNELFRIGEELFSWILQTSWQAAVLVLLVLLAQTVFRRRLSPTWRYALWLLVVVRLLLPSTPPASWSIYNVAGLPIRLRPAQEPEVIREAGSDFYSEQPLPDKIAPDAAVSTLGTSERLANIAPPQVESPVGATEDSFPFSWRRLALVIWAVVASALMARLVWANIRFSRRTDAEPITTNPTALLLLAQCKEKLGISQRVTLIETRKVQSPSVHGLWRKRLLLPEGAFQQFSPDELRCIFTHELAHIKRRDLEVNWVASILLALHWFNPLLWIGFPCMRHDREMACDALALTKLGASQTEPYGETIIKVVANLLRPSRPPGVLALSEDAQHLKERIGMIAAFRERSRWSLLAVSLMLGIAVVGLTNASRARTAEPPVEKSASSSTVEEQEKRPQPVALDAKAVNSESDSVTNAGVEALYTRVFRIQQNAFRENLIDAVDAVGATGSGTNDIRTFFERMREFFALIGVDLQPPKTMFYKDREGILLIRATRDDLDTIEATIQELGRARSQIYTRIQVAEIDPGKAAAFWAGMALQDPARKIAFLDPQEAERQLERLKALAAPAQVRQASVTTLSGRRGQIHIGEILNVREPNDASRTVHGILTVPRVTVNGLEGINDFSLVPVLRFQTNQVPLGIRIDLLPYAGEHDTVQMHVLLTSIEFLGYDDPAQFVPQATEPGGVRPLVAAQPLPHFRLRQLQKSVIGLDQQTLVIGGSEEIETDRVPVFGGDRPQIGRVFRTEQEKELILFITPTISGGNPVSGAASKTASDHTPSPTETAVRDAISLYEMGKLDAAEQRLLSVLQTEPDNAQAQHYLHLVLQAKDRRERGLEPLRGYFQTIPQKPVY